MLVWPVGLTSYPNPHPGLLTTPHPSPTLWTGRRAVWAAVRERDGTADHFPSCFNYWQMPNMFINLITPPWCVISKVKSGGYKVASAGVKYSTLLEGFMLLSPPFWKPWRIWASCLMNNHVTQKWLFQVKAPWKYSLEQHSRWNRL